MKKIFTLVLSISSIICLGQTNSSFKIDEKTLLWQKVYETELTTEKIIDEIQKSGIMGSYNIEGSDLIGELKRVRIDYESSGYSSMTIPMYASRSDLKGFVLVDFKEGRYRVTFKKIFLVTRVEDNIMDKGDETSLDSFALNNSKTQFRSSFKKPRIIIDNMLSKMFDFSKKSEEEDEW